MQTKIVCRAIDCIFNENKVCASEEIIYDPEEGCLTYYILDDLAATEEDAELEDEELVDEDLDWDEDEDEDEDLFLDDEELEDEEDLDELEFDTEGLDVDDDWR